MQESFRDELARDGVAFFPVDATPRACMFDALPASLDHPYFVEVGALLAAAVSSVLLDAQLILTGAKNAREIAGAWHIDIPSVTTLQAGALAAITILWPRCDFTAKTGATEIMVGSHLVAPTKRLSCRPGSDEWPIRRLECAAGRAFAFVGSHVLHRSGANTSGRERKADVMRFQGVWR